LNDSSTKSSRRKLLAFIGALGISWHRAWAAALLPTPRQTSGPFYPERLPLDDDNDLTRVKGRNGVAAGRITDLTGRVLDTGGHAVAGARVEIWQCDANGRYHHSRDHRDVPLDENFQGHGHTVSDAQGGYRFRTIRPVPYPGRTPHIHILVLVPGAQRLITQLYIEGEPRNAEDFVFKSVPAERRSLVVAAFRPASGGAELSARFDLVVGGTPDQT
jgi:protocatechuate 3,4-dioxygenase beta subunit